MTSILKPNPGDDRTWTREVWKATHRTCRVMSKVICPKVDRMTDDVFRDLILYGYSKVRVEDYLD